MRRGVLVLGAAGLLLTPPVVAKFAGGYFAEPRLVAGMVLWALVLALCATGRAPVPRTLAGGLAVGGLALMTAWTAISLEWAPLAGPALASVQRLLVYLGALLLAIGVARAERPLRAFEPGLAAGAVAVIGWGLSERVLPGLITLDRSANANGRLEQPITYWNGMGAVAAVGIVLCARVAGDPGRSVRARALAAAGAAPLGAGVYLSFSRGAIAAAFAGLVVLAALAPVRIQLRAVLTVAGAALACAVVAGVASATSDLGAPLASRERAGAALLVALLVVAGAAAFLTVRSARREDVVTLGATGRRGLALGAAAAVVLAFGGLVVGALGEKPSPREFATANAGRLTSVSSNRYAYWRIGARAFAREPFRGLGAGGFRVEWLKKRTFAENVREVHSLPLEMATELGLVGVVALLWLVAGLVMSARRALHSRRALAAGPAAALVAWFLHASIDWDWQLPAVTLPALVLAGALIALGEVSPRTSASATPPSRADADGPLPTGT